MAASWMLVEIYFENGQSHKFVVESGLTEDEAKETAAEFNENLRVFGITGHRCEAAPEPGRSS